MTMTMPIFFVFLYCIVLIIVSMNGLIQYKRYKAGLRGEHVKQPLLGMLYTTLTKKRFMRTILVISLKFGVYFYAYLLYPHSWMLMICGLLAIGRLYVLWMPLEKLRQTRWDVIILFLELTFVTLFTASLLVYEA
ncbi:hypothetical protein [Kurthia massiliensis]|uniref:hypothetical protein n=1 Tax=Kurthia massiliensis TaxID=1033739 RepID=UPI0011CBF4A7|nr:hypothetical protein [Kurthia massiliensis]